MDGGCHGEISTRDILDGVLKSVRVEDTLRLFEVLLKALGLLQAGLVFRLKESSYFIQ